MFLNQITNLINKFEITMRNKTIAEFKKKNNRPIEKDTVKAKRISRRQLI